MDCNNSKLIKCNYKLKFKTIALDKLVLVSIESSLTEFNFTKLHRWLKVNLKDQTYNSFFFQNMWVLYYVSSIITKFITCQWKSLNSMQVV